MWVLLLLNDRLLAQGVRALTSISLSFARAPLKNLLLTNSLQVARCVLRMLLRYVVIVNVVMAFVILLWWNVCVGTLRIVWLWLATHFTGAFISSPAQSSILFLKAGSVGFCLILSLRVFQRKLPLKDSDSNPSPKPNVSIIDSLYKFCIFRF